MELNSSLFNKECYVDDNSGDSGDDGVSSNDAPSDRCKSYIEQKVDDNTQQSFWNARDTFLGWFLFGVSVCVRFYRLGLPPAVVFDEYHFGTFVDNILGGETYFDIHPPLGKLTLAFFGYMVGYRPHPNFGYDEIGKEYGAVLYFPLREIAALFGAVTVPLMYATARKIGVSWTGSFLCAALFCFDNLNIIESRLILTDSQIVFYLVFSLYCALQLWSSRPKSFSRYFWLSMTAFICGCSVSVKWTALGTPGLISIVSFFGFHFLEYPLTLVECTCAGILGIGLYIFLFFVHFKTMTRTGPGVGFFPLDFRATLIGEPNYDPEAKRKPFFHLLWYLNKYMFTANAGITSRHHWESTWYQWIINWRGLLYYNQQIDKDWAAVYLHNNPVVCWVCGAFVMLFIVTFLMSIRYRSCKLLSISRRIRFHYASRTCVFLFWGWLINLLPYILVDRSAFVYHYLPGLIYAQLLTGVVVDQLPFPLRVLTTITILTATLAAFIYYMPWIYCFPISSDEHAARRWLPRWD